ncbi:tetratricopeptide repeat protein [Microvirga solisilvae]|uniref:tetratricopeptide repeat protein n=1 Tax=Microvirga solisilvae TaxID=2919498 RepID=UPI001FB01213|nr:tetratricopeptide repeat protein [Microvirga solisilvae]
MDPDQFFSIRETLAELNTLEKKVSSGDQEAQGELNFLRGFVLYRAERAAESLPPSVEALRIDAARPFLSDQERTRLTYNIALQAEAVGDWRMAIEFYKKAMPLFDAASEYSEDQRLGLRERLAYCLHEARSYSEALALNKQVLAGGEKLFGPDSSKLYTVLTNLAQNAHALNEMSAARGFLERLLDIAMKRKAMDKVDTALFQLGVLSSEEGRFKEAEAFMKRRLELAEKSGNASRIADAKEDLEILYEKTPR